MWSFGWKATKLSRLAQNSPWSIYRNTSINIYISQIHLHSTMNVNVHPPYSPFIYVQMVVFPVTIFVKGGEGQSVLWTGAVRGRFFFVATEGLFSCSRWFVAPFHLVNWRDICNIGQMRPIWFEQAVIWTASSTYNMLPRFRPLFCPLKMNHLRSHQYVKSNESHRAGDIMPNRHFRK